MYLSLLTKKIVLILIFDIVVFTCWTSILLHKVHEKSIMSTLGKNNSWDVKKG